MDGEAGAGIDGNEAPRRESAALVVVAITLLGLILRIVYFTGAEVAVPIRGDILGYWNYAWNLVEHGVFSGAEPGAATPAPDSWRSPGYPAFLALCLKLAGAAHAVLVAQCLQLLLGALLPPLTIALGRRWLPKSLALLAGLLVAIWPHLVVFASTLLSETLFAFALLLLSVLLALAFARDDKRLAAAAGVAAALAALVNPLLLLFPPSIGLLLFWRRRPRLALAYLLPFLLVSGAWAVRNAGLEGGSGGDSRALTNLVQGSWPRYHDAYNDRFRNEIALAHFSEIDEEVNLMVANPRAGFASMAGRFEAEPATYLRWYLLQKPWLLWDWGVRIGWGDIYFLETQRSPFERVAALRAVHAVCKALNPLLFGLALLASVVAAWRLRARDASTADFALAHAALLFAYVTAVHVVLQAEPRYAVAYRPIEILLAASAVGMFVRWRRRAGEGA